MAIAVAIPKYVSRSTGGNACCKSAYNARTRIVDERTAEVFDWVKRGGNVYHEMLLPEYVDKKFKDPAVLSNEIEKCEKRINSQLFVEWVVPLAKEADGVDLEFRIETAKEFVRLKGWVKEGVGVQIDIHEPHEDEVNWHAHILVTTRRFALNGKEFGAKARDLQPDNRNGRVQNRHELNDNILLRDIQNSQFKARGMSTRVDLPGELTQEHVGPVRMRSVLNQAADRNQVKQIANIKLMNSGKRLLEKVTCHMSLFNIGDLERAVKFVPSLEVRERLVQEALANKSLVALYDESGKGTGYYTTAKIRTEEKKLLRLSSYIASSKNVISLMGAKIVDRANKLIESVPESFSEEQKIALSNLLMGESGLRILRGRAGTGKSHVLGQVATIAKECGVNVIGLAPTHKARDELAKKPGFEQNDTVKGMLFKLYNAKFELPKYSLLVVDEAGMVGNDDYNELLRVAADRNCSVILAGDERQLASVQRGGMFEIFADKYGSSTILDIQRQENAWGRAVAMAFSNGEVIRGLSILHAKNRLIEHGTKDESMQSLLKDWSKSDEKIADRLIIAVKNKDVDALNHGARQYLKLEGILTGEELAVAGHYYMKGDRILIKEMHKALGLTNGDLAQLVHVSKERFVLKIEGRKGEKTKEISFDPSKYNGFRHGYATTVFKAQAASIKDVFVFHDGFAGIRNSYVALSRNVKELKLYINKEATKNIDYLVRQLSFDPEVGSSLIYQTKQELQDNALREESDRNKGIVRGWLDGALKFASKKMTKFNDKHFLSMEYYKYTAPAVKAEKIEEVLDNIGKEYVDIAAEVQLEEKAVVGGNIINGRDDADYKESIIQIKSNDDGYARGNTNNIVNSKPRVSAKDRFYARADYVRNKAENVEVIAPVQNNEKTVVDGTAANVSSINKEAITPTKATVGVNISNNIADTASNQPRPSAKDEFYKRVENVGNKVENIDTAPEIHAEEKAVMDESSVNIGDVSNIPSVTANIANNNRAEDVEAIVLAQTEERAVVDEATVSILNVSNKEGSAEAKNPDGINTLNIVTNSTGIKPKQSAKDKFYARADYARDKAVNGSKKLQQKAVWDNETEQLRHQVRFKTEQIARDLLGEPNKKLSNGKTLRFGEQGKIAVRISGEGVGSWFDFSSSTGGDIFTLVQEKQSCDFKQAAEYLRNVVGMKSSNLRLVHDHQNSNLTEEYIKAKNAEERAAKAKEAMVSKLFARAKDIGTASVAHRYLTLKRDITCGVGSDIKTTGIFVYDKQTTKVEAGKAENSIGRKGQYLPAIVAFARDAQGVVTGGQQILLDKHTGGKTELCVAKKSFGRISGSFVEVGRVENASNAKSDVTIIAEGLETALSIKQALANDSKNKGIELKVLCSLGISNIKNYQPTTVGEKIIIAADNDGEGAKTVTTIETAKGELANKGAFVEVVRPDKTGDFNDVLQNESEGKITKQFAQAMSLYTTKSLEQYFANNKDAHKLSEQEKDDIAYIQKHNVPQEQIIEAYRKDIVTGKFELQRAKSISEFAELDKTKMQTKTFDELLPILKLEQQMAYRLEKESPEVFEKLTERKLNTDPQIVESLARDKDFLIKNNIVIEKNLFESVQTSKNIAITAKDMFRDCQRYAQRTTLSDVSSVDKYDRLGKEEEVIKLLKDNKTKYQELAPYLKDTAERRTLEHLSNRLAVYEIAEEHSRKHPEQSQKFKEEMQALYRFSKLGMEAALKTYKEKGLDQAISFAKERNIDRVLSHLGIQSHILYSTEKLKGQAYTTAAAKDKVIMRYVDSALLKGKSFDNSAIKNNNLLDYANQRDIDKTLEGFKGSSLDRKLFNKNIENLKRFGQSKDLRDGLTVFKDKGINALVRHTDTTCANLVLEGIRKDFVNIRKKQPVELLNYKYQERSDYLTAISKDEKVMKYISPNSEIGKEIEQQNQDNNKAQTINKDFDREH